MNWTPQEIATLTTLRHDGARFREIATRLGRSWDSVTMKWQALVEYADGRRVLKRWHCPSGYERQYRTLRALIGAAKAKPEIEYRARRDA